MNLLWAVVILSLSSQVLSKPFSIDDEDDYTDSLDSEGRRRMKHKKRPCQKSEDGRTFFPVQLSYVDVNYNYECGGQSSGHSLQEDPVSNTNNNRPHRPNKHGNHRPHGSGNRPHGSGNRPHGSGGHGSNKPNSQQSDEVTIGTPQDVPNDAVQEGTFSTTRRPHRPGFLLQNVNGAFFQNAFNTLFGNNNKRPLSGMSIPVHENVQDTATTKFEPGQYITAYSPLTGQYVQDVSNLTPKQLYRRFSRGLDQLLTPVYDLF